MGGSFMASGFNVPGPHFPDPADRLNFAHAYAAGKVNSGDQYLELTNAGKLQDFQIYKKGEFGPETGIPERSAYGSRVARPQPPTPESRPAASTDQSRRGTAGVRTSAVKLQKKSPRGGAGTTVTALNSINTRKTLLGE